MTEQRFGKGVITTGGDYEPGSPMPTGYGSVLDWHRAHQKAGWKQVWCDQCACYTYRSRIAAPCGECERE